MLLSLLVHFPSKLYFFTAVCHTMYFILQVSSLILAAQPDRSRCGSRISLICTLCWLRLGPQCLPWCKLVAAAWHHMPAEEAAIPSFPGPLHTLPSLFLLSIALQAGSPIRKTGAPSLPSGSSELHGLPLRGLVRLLLYYVATA